ncbi:hypothetical protein SLS56_009597 [Neofusicoccum ribis]|uniref:J domain-containing protein n=1 Tax=Neofusicoccum ribis TaxID=45134 RepID=A0ABR3SH82_9PEZI
MQRIPYFDDLLENRRNAQPQRRGSDHAMSVSGARQKMQPEDRPSKMLESAGTAIGTGMTGTMTVTPAGMMINPEVTSRDLAAGHLAVILLHTRAMPQPYPQAPPANETPTQRFVRLTKTPYGFYDILGVDREASQADIRKAYRRIALLHHPDRNPDDQENADARFKAINEAHETLTDDLQKKRYDIFGMQPLS